MNSEYMTYEDIEIQELISNGLMTQKYNSDKYYVGSEWCSKNNELFDIIGKDIMRDGYYYIQFYNDPEIIKSVQIGNIVKGSVNNPNTPSLCDIGYIGEGNHNTKSKSYSIWSSMIERCYSIRCNNKQPTYAKVIVCETWHNFQNFAEWFEDNYIEGYQLDKDLLSGDIKIYSPETCVFLPRDINLFLSNNYKNNSSGFTGVSKFRNKWMVHLGKRYLGLYSSPEEGYKIYLKVRSVEINKIKNRMKSLGYESYIIERIK